MRSSVYASVTGWSYSKVVVCSTWIHMSLLLLLLGRGDGDRGRTDRLGVEEGGRDVPADLVDPGEQRVEPLPEWPDEQVARIAEDELGAEPAEEALRLAGAAADLRQH